MSSLSNGDCGGASASAWRRSTFCASGECVEVAVSDGGAILVRDSKVPQSEPLSFTQDEFRAFVLGAAAGQYNDLAGL